MGVAFGSPVSSANTNQAFIDANDDDATIGRLDFQNTLPESGDPVINIQREVNSLDSYSGRSPGSAKNALPSWTNNEVGSPTDTLVDRSDAITHEFNGTTGIGHGHTGVDGDGAKVDAQYIDNVKLKSFAIQGTQITGATGGSTDVSALMTGKTPSTGSAVKGVVVTAPYNKLPVRHTDGSEVVDGSGNVVYGRITESSGVWTLTYYVLITGTETPYSFGAPTDLDWYYLQLINIIADPGYEYASEFFVPSDNATADVVDASATQRGLVSAGAQTLGGKKNFQDGVKVGTSIELPESVDSSTTGANASLTPSAVLIEVTNASLVSINNIATPTDGKFLVLINKTGGSVNIINDAGGTAANRIRTGTSADLSMQDGSSIIFVYDAATSRWQIVGGTGGGSAFDSLFAIKNFSDPAKIAMFDASGITTGTTRTFAFPDANTELVGKDAQQILTNKDIDGATASNLSRITVPKDTYANLVALTRKAGTVLYATDQSAYYGDNGTSLMPLGAVASSDVTAQYSIGTSNLSTGAGSDILFPSVAFDPTSSYNPATGKFTAPYTGKYLVQMSEVNSSGNYYYIYVNGVFRGLICWLLNSGYVEFGNNLLDLSAGDFFTIRPASADTLLYSAGNYAAKVSVALVAGPIPVTATNAASYYLSANFNSDNATPINFDTVIDDPNNLVTPSPTSWKFTVPTNGAGRYLVSMVGLSASVPSNWILIFKNGVFLTTLAYLESGGIISGTAYVNLVSGDYIDVRVAGGVVWTIAGGTPNANGGTSTIYIKQL